MTRRARSTRGARNVAFTGRGIGCCGYAATDGGELMKRLMEREFVRRDPERRGAWLLGR